MVESLGNHCMVVSDGAQAWEAFQLHRPDVVITDWVMPGLSSVELCRKSSPQTNVARPHRHRRRRCRSGAAGVTQVRRS